MGVPAQEEREGICRDSVTSFSLVPQGIGWCPPTRAQVSFMLSMQETISLRDPFTYALRDNVSLSGHPLALSSSCINLTITLAELGSDTEDQEKLCGALAE